VLKRRNKSGKLKKQLGIKPNERITNKLLNLILNARIGSIVINPSNSGDRRIRVSKLIARRTLLTKRLRKGKIKNNGN